MPHIHELYDFVVSAFIVHRKRVLLVFHKRYDEWLPIGGHIELHEDPEEALYREIKEECGLKVKIFSQAPPIKHRGVKPLPTPDYVDAHSTHGKHRHVAFVYFGKSSSDKVKLHTREHAEFRWFTAQELKDPKLKLVPSIYFYCVKALERAGALAVLGFFLLSFFGAVPSEATPIQYAKVIEVMGKAEVRSSHTVTWTPLLPETFLKNGTKIRTHEKSLVRIKLDWKLEGFMELAENSILTVWDYPPSQIALEKGKLFLMRERDMNIGSATTGASEPFLSVTTKDLSVRLGLVGIEISVTEDGSWVKVFGSEMDIQTLPKGNAAPKSLQEGFKLFTSQKFARADLKRMDYQDYAPWLSWVKKVYEKKSDFFSDYFEKNYL